MNVYIEPIVVSSKKQGEQLVGLVITRSSGVTFAIVKEARDVNSDRTKLDIAWGCLRNNSEVLKVKLKLDVTFTVTKYMSLKQLLLSEFSRFKQDGVAKIGLWDPMDFYKKAVATIDDQTLVTEAITAGGAMVCGVKLDKDSDPSTVELITDSPFEFMNLFNRFQKRWKSIRSEQRPTIFAKLYKNEKSVSKVLEEHFPASQHNQLTSVDNALLTSCEAIQNGILGFLAMTISVVARKG